MHIKAIASVAALSVALGFGSLAFAQDAATALPTMIGNQQLNEADAQRVKVYCDDLKTAADQAVGTETESGDGATTESESSGEVGSVDMEAITIELCAEAGFIEPTAP